jgi:hypothetical protein
MEGGPSQGVPIGSVQVQVQASDLNSASQEEEVDQGNEQGVWPRRVYTRGQWSMNEPLTLCTVYKEWYAEQGPNSSNCHIHHQTTTQKWDIISEQCNDMDVVKTLDQCKDKWDYTRKDFKKVWDYEKHTPSGRLSFWAMTGSEGKSALKLSTIMAKEVYDQLCSWLPCQSREFDI